MKAHQIFSEMKDDTAKGVFQYLRTDERPVYAAALTTLATNRKLRPVFVQKKTVPEQINWLVSNVRLKGANEVAENVLQIWLLKGNRKMLIAFLDGLGIEHDGEGAAEDIPEEMDAKDLKKTVDKMLAEFDTELVKVYLHMFQMQRPDGWKEITDLIAENPDLQYQTASDSKKAEDSKNKETTNPPESNKTETTTAPATQEA